jgi:hypothetical protein
VGRQRPHDGAFASESIGRFKQQTTSDRGQTETNSARSHLFRVTLELGHYSMRSACLRSARSERRDKIAMLSCGGHGAILALHINAELVLGSGSSFAISTATPAARHRNTDRDQDRYVMITFPTSQIQNPVLPRRPPIRHGGARANMPLPRQRRHRSSWLTADSRTCDRPIMRRNVVSQQTHRRRLPSRTSVVRKPP